LPRAHVRVVCENFIICTVEACLQRVTERTFYGISPLSGLPLRKILSGLPVI